MKFWFWFAQIWLPDYVPFVVKALRATCIRRKSVWLNPNILSHGLLPDQLDEHE